MALNRQLCIPKPTICQAESFDSYSLKNLFIHSSTTIVILTFKTCNQRDYTAELLTYQSSCRSSTMTTTTRARFKGLKYVIVAAVVVPEIFAGPQAAAVPRHSGSLDNHRLRHRHHFGFAASRPFASPSTGPSSLDHPKPFPTTTRTEVFNDNAKVTAAGDTDAAGIILWSFGRSGTNALWESMNEWLSRDNDDELRLQLFCENKEGFVIQGKEELTDNSPTRRRVNRCAARRHSQRTVRAPRSHHRAATLPY